MKTYTLAVCIPTFNRSDILFESLQNYLKSDESRVCFTVQDNCSTDGSFEMYQSIHDERLRVRQNAENIGALLNAKAALSNNSDAEYILFSIDKDRLEMNYLSKFIDYLESEKPGCGCLDVYGDTNERIENFPKGIEAVRKTGYLSKHPTGFFWRRDYFDEEIKKPYFKALPVKFDFWFDVVMAHCASQYGASFVYIPAILHGARSKAKPTKTLTYNDTNYFFGYPKRMETYEIYPRDLLSLDVPKKEKMDMAVYLMRNTMGMVSVGLRSILCNNWEVYHYGFKWRVMSWHEMIGNVYYVYRLYASLLKDIDTFRHLKGAWAMSKVFVHIMYTSLKGFINSPKCVPYIAKNE